MLPQTDRAAIRIDEALADMRTFAARPHRGTEHPKIRPGIRTVTHRSFIFYFEIVEPSSDVRILANLSSAAPNTDDRQSIVCGTEGSCGSAGLKKPLLRQSHTRVHKEECRSQASTRASRSAHLGGAVKAASANKCVSTPTKLPLKTKA
jgi:plasmid stabilization system protein ParE